MNRNSVKRRTHNSKLHDGEGAEYEEEHPRAFVLFAGQCGSLGRLCCLHGSAAAWGTCVICRAGCRGRYVLHLAPVRGEPGGIRVKWIRKVKRNRK